MMMGNTLMCKYKLILLSVTVLPIILPINNTENFIFIIRKKKYNLQNATSTMHFLFSCPSFGYTLKVYAMVYVNTV